MQIKNQKRNEFRRTETPENTINRIKNGLHKIDLKADIKVMNVHDRLWSVQLAVPSIRAVASGKGCNKELAIASAYSELAERISAGMETGLAFGPFRQLYGSRADKLTKVTSYKYMKGYRWAHQDSLGNKIGVEDLLRNIPDIDKKLLDEMKMDSKLLRHWVPGWSLVHNKVVYVPILFVKWISSTNGLAAGNTIEEAIVHGACEIFERSAMIEYIRHNHDTPIIDQSTIKNPIIHEMLAYFEKNNHDIVIRDISRGLYPVFALLTFNNNLPTNHIWYNTIKAGSSFDTDEAIIRCFTERMQCTKFDLEESQGTRTDDIQDDKYLPMFFKGICPMDLRPYKDGKSIPYKYITEMNTADEVGICVEIAKAMNTDFIVIDHTHPVLNFPTARVIIPGVSDFMRWWDSKKLTSRFIANLQPEEDAYEDKLMFILDTFFIKKKFEQSKSGVITSTED